MNLQSLVKEKKVLLAGKGLQDGDDTEVLAQVLREGVVEELNLMCNRIALVDDNFTDALAQNSSLKVLNLYGNHVGNALKVNTSLQQLFLEGNQVGDEGVERLAEALTVNANGPLRVLILCGNGIGDAGAQSLGVSFLFNRSLRVVLLGEHFIDNKGEQYLADCLECNPVIDQLLLDGNRMSNILEERVKTILSNGKRKSTNIRKQALPKHIVESLLKDKDNKIAIKDLALAAKDEEMTGLQTLLKAKQQENQEKDRLITVSANAQLKAYCKS